VGQTSGDVADPAEVIKALQEEIDYIAAQRLGDPPLLLKSLDVDLTLVSKDTSGADVQFKIIVVEAGGKAEVIRGLTMTTHLTLRPNTPPVFPGVPRSLPGDKFVIEQLRQIKAGLRAADFIPTARNPG